MSYIVEKPPLKDGTKVYRLYEHYTDPLTGKKHIASVKLKSTSRQSVNAAQRQLDAVIVQKLSGSIPGSPKSTVTLRALCDMWLVRQKKDNRTKATIARNTWASDMLCDLIGANRLIDRFTAPIIKNALEKDNPSPGKYNERLTRFRALIHFAYDEELVDNINYLGKLKKKPDLSKISKLKNKYLEPNEVKMLINAAKHDTWREVIQILTLTGMRIGELIALEINDVDMAEKTISITKTLETVPDIIVPMPKTAASIREISIQKQLYDVLTAVIKRREKLLKGYGCKTDFLFFDPNGEHIGYPAFLKYIKTLSKAVIGRKITPHVLRHTYTALAAAEDVPLEVISRRLGHATSRVTEEIYYHITEKQKEKDRALLDNISLF